MMLGDAELSRRFSMQDEAEQKAKIDREQANELEYVDCLLYTSKAPP